MNIPDLLDAALNVVGVAAFVAALTPTPVDNAVLGVLRKLLDFAAMNWGHAKNKGPDNA